MSNIHTETFKVRTAEINPLKQMHPHAMIQLMQEASMQHTIRAGVSVWDMEAIHASWVLLRMEVRFYHFPELNETIRVETYPCGMEGYFTYRDYKMYGIDGRLYAEIASQWTLMNTDERRMMRIPETFRNLIHHVDKISKPDFKIHAPVPPFSEHQTVVNYFQLDWNGHINNVHLIRMVMETLPTDFHRHYTLKKLQLQFRHEAFVDIPLTIRTSDTSGAIKQHSISTSDTQQEILLVLSEWT